MNDLASHILDLNGGSRGAVVVSSDDMGMEKRKRMRSNGDQEMAGTDFLPLSPFLTSTLQPTKPK